MTTIINGRQRPSAGPTGREIKIGQRKSAVYVGLHHTQLAMPEGEESAARGFYAGVLGLDEIAKPPGLAGRGGVWFSSGALELHLGVQVPFRPAAKGHPGILVSDLDQVIRRLREAGRDVIPDNDFPGFWRIYTADVFGNRLEFLRQDAELKDL